MSAEGARRSALLVDWGGVLTTDLFASFKAFCEREGLDPDALRQAFRANPDAAAVLVEFECGRVEEHEFELHLAHLLGVDQEGLIDRLFEGTGPDLRMIAAVERAREHGVPTALVSNSWGTRRYPRDVLERLFDGIVISGEVGIRKPSKKIYALGAESIDVPVGACVFVDDLEQNLVPARELGMAAVHHREAEATIAELEALLGVELAT